MYRKEEDIIMSKKNLYCLTIVAKRRHGDNTQEVIDVLYIEGVDEALSEKHSWEDAGYIVDMIEMGVPDILEVLRWNDETTTYYTNKPLGLWLNL